MSIFRKYLNKREMIDEGVLERRYSLRIEKMNSIINKLKSVNEDLRYLESTIGGSFSSEEENAVPEELINKDNELSMEMNEVFERTVHLFGQLEGN